MSNDKLFSKSLLGGAGLLLFAGCAGQVTSDSPDVAATAQAVTLIDCQTDAAECLGALPSPAGVVDCRNEFDLCTAGVADEAVANVGNLGDCRDAAVECAANASSFTDAAQCRMDFEACLGGAVSLPTLPAPGLNLPDLNLPDLGTGGVLPDAVATLEATDMCRQDAADCVVAAAGDVAATADCADAFRMCVGDVLTTVGSGTGGSTGGSMGGGGTSTPPMGGGSSLTDCRDQAVECVDMAAGDPSDVAQCGEDYAACVGVDPNGGLLGNAGTIVTLPVRGTLEGADCLINLQTCVLGGGSLSDCVDEARMCAGL